MHKPHIYLGTIALEVNRWSSRIPTFLVSQWIPKIRDAGFDGLELWENHVLLSPGEAEKIKDSGFLVAIYNHYGGFTNSPEDVDRRIKAAEMINFLNAGAVKYNIGNDPAMLPVYKENVLKFAESVPAKLLCECHGGTLLETNEQIAAFFDGLCPDKFGIMVHPFEEPDILQTKFELFTNRLTHIHSQITSSEGQRICLEEWPERVQACFDVMKANNFSGNFTVEFTGLTAAPEENINSLFTNTVKDLNYIRRYY